VYDMSTEWLFCREPDVYLLRDTIGICPPRVWKQIVFTFFEGRRRISFKKKIIVYARIPRIRILYAPRLHQTRPVCDISVRAWMCGRGCGVGVRVRHYIHDSCSVSPQRWFVSACRTKGWVSRKTGFDEEIS